MTVLYTPLDIPKILPNDWDEWWHVWNTSTSNLSKTYDNHNIGANDLWKGVNLYKNPEYKVTYDCADAIPCKVVDNLVEQVFSYIPTKVICIRVIENLQTINYHSDHTYTKQQIRSVLWSNYTDDIWNFKYNSEIKSASIPEDTNTFYYLDHPLEHSAIYDSNKSKGLLVVYGHSSIDTKLLDLATTSASKYKNHAWII